jgi:DNA-binding CsgD family transcriptional regulator
LTVVSLERLRDDIAGLLHRGSGVRDFSLEAARLLRRAVGFEGVCFLTMDPATLVPTGHVVEHGLPESVYVRMAEMELRGEDFNAFRALAVSGRRAATLSAATGGELERSRRHREIRAPNGFGDELRAPLVDDHATWGALTLLRGADQAPFSPAETAVVGSLSQHLAEGLRRALLLAQEPNAHGAGDDATGLVVLAPDDSVAFADEAASLWLEELGASAAGLPHVVHAVAAQARAVVDGRAPDGRIARARVRAATGRWLLVRGSTLGDEPDAQVAVMIEPAHPHELAPLIADACALTERERTVTELVARGLPTDAIAARLHLSPWTVQDHLKAIFEKVGVGTRGELVARLFFEQREPVL